MLKTNTSLIMQGAPDTLTAKREKELFLLFEAQKVTVAELEALPSRTRSESSRLGAARRRVRSTREYLIKANMALLLFVANKFVTRNVTHDEMVACGLDKLMYCVDRFDVHKGWKFSSYATQSIWRMFLMLQRVESKHHMGRSDCDPQSVARSTAATVHGDPDELLDLKIMFESNTAGLTKMQARVVALRFGMNGASGGMTLKEVGVVVGLTKERVRQIQVAAQAKMLAAMNS